ncbi:DeoR/GlpR family DNA-binding transcription regulator [Phyllobacterium sp. YR531]|uniref:DeoR/GlpR family DNA-binding transcription regulator n=1 Tax=Phyllobacterium sp. YR531 TaxID=1144343 RepID=UPI003297B214
MGNTDMNEEGKKQRRQAALIHYIEQNNYISVEEITELFSVTTQTARRDVIALEAIGKIRRLHGGAASITSIDPLTYRARRVENAAQKARIGKIVADIIPDGAALFIDTGTTCEAIATALASRRDLRIVTYSLRVATILCESPTFTVAVPGGFVRSIDGGVFREDTAQYIRKFKFDYAVISVSGIDKDGDICDDDHAEVAAVSAALLQSERTILAVDSSKFGKRALVKLGTLDDVDILVTDALPNDGSASKWANKSLKIHT